MRGETKKAAYWKPLLLGIVLMLAVGLFGELAANWRSLGSPDKRGSVLLDLQSVQADGARLEQGALAAESEEVTVRVTFPKQYVKKFYYTYVSPNLNVSGDVTVVEEKNGGRKQEKVLTEKNSVLHTDSVLTVDAVTGEVRLHFDAPTDGLRITSIGISDAPSFSKLRFLFFAVLTGLLYLVWIFKETAAHRLERMFLILVLPIGILMILGLSPRESGWDEHIHFYRAYSLLYDLQGKETMPVAEPMYDYMNTGAKNEPFYFPRSKEEHAAERAYGENGRAEAAQNPALYRPTNGLHLYSIAYLPQTLFLALGLLFRVPFWLLFAFGRFGNLLCYGALSYFAIRHMRRGKGILTAAALLPTPVFLASTYSYDAFINGCFLLGFSYFFVELFEERRPVSYRNLAVFAGAVLLGSLPKAVYLPVLLLGFLFPAKRFRNPKEAAAFRAALVLVTALLLASFVMPAAGGSEAASDPRGGATSAPGQLAFLLSAPFSYLKLALGSIRDTLFSFTFGKGVAANLAYRGYPHYGDWTAVFLAAVLLADNTGRYPGSLKKRQKLVIGTVLLGIAGLIWTALYLSFTPVGLAQINGVQPRYYLPLLVPFYLLLAPKRIENRMPESTYHRLLLGGSLFFLLDGAWTILQMCV